MGPATIDAVLAGTKGFAVALLAPLTARIGNRPRVAADPGQVLAMCKGPSALAVVEFTGEGSLPTIQALVRDGRGLRVVAGVPAAHAAAEGTLLALGVQVARWDGKIEGVVSAVDRAIAEMSGAAPAQAPAQPRAVSPPAPAPAALRPAPAKPAASAPRPPAAAAPPPARPVPAAAVGPAAAPRPAASVPAAPRAAPPASAPAPAAAALRPTAGAPAMAAARPVAAPAAPPASPAPRAAARPPADPPPPSLSRAAPASPAAAPAAARPAPGVKPVAAAVPAPAWAPPPPVAAPAAAAAAAPPPAARPPATFFDDLDPALDVDVSDEGPSAGAAPAAYAPAARAPAPASPKGAWPAVSSAAEAEEAMRLALAGTADPSRPLHALATTVLEGLSALERDVLEEKPQPIETGPIRRAALMRLRVAEGLASAPPTGTPVDTAVLSGILGEIDGLLAEVAPLLQDAPEELAPALQSIRNALVSEAIDFSEMAQRVAGTAAPAPEARAAPRAPAARLLSVETPGEQPEPGRGRRIAIGVLLALAVLGAAAYHGLRWYRLQELKKTPPGLPSGMTDLGASKSLPKTSPRVIFPGEVPTDPAEIEKFKAEQAAQGNKVFQAAGGELVIVPNAPEAGKTGNK